MAEKPTEMTLDELVEAAVRDGLGSLALVYLRRAYTLGQLDQIREELKAIQKRSEEQQR